MNLNAVEAQIQRAMFWSTITELVVLAIVIFVMYWVTKTAIRDGIKESGLVEALARAQREPRTEGTTQPMTLNDLR